ncbi:HepT-like ribonuclease domain-containing protein [Methylocapsa aurea]|uniref:HepT-like ribonuclease domain-containing protein n=1 Tax=Methylocapsa aurea TaxID=663610 RepID=UPI000A6933E6|nr:HepT-like ribonuclease domain-containing protein [Methylocapsa aurea]
MVSAKLPQARLQHILAQIDGIVAATQGLAFEQVNNSFLYERAVERAVQIISEAAKELRLELRNK